MIQSRMPSHHRVDASMNIEVVQFSRLQQQQQQQLLLLLLQLLSISPPYLDGSSSTTGTAGTRYQPTSMV